MKLLSHLKIRTKLASVVVLAALTVFAIVAIAATLSRSRMLDDRINQMRTAVDLLYGLAQSFQDDVTAGKRHGQHRHGRGQRPHSSANRLSHLRRMEAIRLRRPEPARTRCLPLLYQDQDSYVALALGHQGRGKLRHPNHELGSSTIGPAPRPTWDGSRADSLLRT